MSEKRERYYKAITAIDECFGDVITSYVREMEEQNNEMLEALKRLAAHGKEVENFCTMGTGTYDIAKKAIEKVTGLKIEEVLK